MMTETCTPRLAPAPPRLFDEGEWGTVHLDAETAWTLSEFLMQLAAEVVPQEYGAEGFRRQEALLAYAAELKGAAAAQLDDADGAQCRARLAEIAANDAHHKACMAATAEQAVPPTPPLHA
jgi:hypothetical protein